MATGYSVPGTMYSMQQSHPYPSMNPTHPAAMAGNDYESTAVRLRARICGGGVVAAALMVQANTLPLKSLFFLSG